MQYSFIKKIALYSILLMGLTACAAQKKKRKSRAPETTVAPNPPQQNIARALYEKAHYPGGEEAMHAFIQKTKKFPQDAVNEGVEGRVMVQVTVQADGTLSDVTVRKGLHPSLDKEAVRVVSAMPKWVPAKDKGKAVAARIMIPVNFYFLR